jgi:hypothetical protein
MSSTNENAATVAGDKPKTAGNGTPAIVATPSLGPSAASGAAPTVPETSWWRVVGGGLREDQVTGRSGEGATALHCSPLFALRSLLPI